MAGRAWTMLALAVLVGCSRAPQLDVDHAWVRLAAVPGRPAAAYFTVHGGPAPTTLIAVASDEARAAEMHETMASGAMSSMAPLARVAVPAGGSVAFAPGGRHVMLFDVNPGVRPGGEMLLRFNFARGDQLTRRARVVAAGDPPPP